MRSLFDQPGHGFWLRPARTCADRAGGRNATNRVAPYRARAIVAEFRTLARRNPVVASTGSGTGPAGADVRSRTPRHWRHVGRALGGNQQAVLARITPASRFEPEGAKALASKPYWRDMMLNAQALADLYVAAWNEPDAAKRSSALAALWSPEAVGDKGPRGYAALTRLTPATPGKSVEARGRPLSRRPERAPPRRRCDVPLGDAARRERDRARERARVPDRR